MGIGHMHSLGVLYRDLKPENILLTPDGHTKISDMGLVKILDNLDDQIGGTAGTPGYRAPEVLQVSCCCFAPESFWSAFNAELFGEV